MPRPQENASRKPLLSKVLFLLGGLLAVALLAGRFVVHSRLEQLYRSPSFKSQAERVLQSATGTSRPATIARIGTENLPGFTLYGVEMGNPPVTVERLKIDLSLVPAIVFGDLPAEVTGRFASGSFKASAQLPFYEALGSGRWSLTRLDATISDAKLGTLVAAFSSGKRKGPLVELFSLFRGSVKGQLHYENPSDGQITGQITLETGRLEMKKIHRRIPRFKVRPVTLNAAYRDGLLRFEKPLVFSAKPGRLKIRGQVRSLDEGPVGAAQTHLKASVKGRPAFVAVCARAMNCPAHLNLRTLRKGGAISRSWSLNGPFRSPNCR